MSSNGIGVSSNANAEERGEFGRVSLQEPSNDVAEIKKAAATASSGGILNHPGASRTLFIDVRSTAHTDYFVATSVSRRPPVAHCCSASRLMLLFSVYHDDRHK